MPEKETPMSDYNKLESLKGALISRFRYFFSGRVVRCFCFWALNTIYVNAVTLLLTLLTDCAIRVSAPI